MQFNVASLLQESSGAAREYVIDDDIQIDAVSHHVRGRARMDRTPRGVFVRAHVAGDMDSECSRCIRPIRFPVDITIEEEYIPTIDINTGQHIAAPEDDADAYRITERHLIDLSEAVLQYWSIALPIAPLCAEDCRGLCPECGELIADDHDCAPDRSDARWSKLANLKL